MAIMPQVTLKRLVATAVILLAACAVAFPAAAPQPAVEITLIGIQAAKEDKPHIDPQLAGIADELRRQPFNAFRMAGSGTRSVPIGQQWELALPEGYVFRAQPDSQTDEAVTLTLSWMQVTRDDKGRQQVREVVSTRVALRRGKYFLSGGGKLKNGAIFGAAAAK